MRSIGFAVLLTAAVFAQDVSAQERPEDGRDRSGHVSVFFLVKADSRLFRIPDRLVTGQLDFQKAYLITGAASKVLVRRFTFLGRGNSLELEGQLGQHVGREDTTEADAAIVLRSGQLGVFGGTSLNVAWGNGFSYAFTTPREENGEAGIQGVGAKKAQYYMTFETELTDSSAPHVHVVLRLAHRSGIYGLISSDKTGSNYLGGGLRFDLR